MKSVKTKPRNKQEGVNGVNRLATDKGRENITDYRQNEEEITD